jgi:hypothetical protein
VKCKKHGACIANARSPLGQRISTTLSRGRGIPSISATISFWPTLVVTAQKGTTWPPVFISADGSNVIEARLTFFNADSIKV